MVAALLTRKTVRAGNSGCPAHVLLLEVPKTKVYQKSRNLSYLLEQQKYIHGYSVCLIQKCVYLMLPN